MKHKWKKIGGHATGMSGGLILECENCGWKFSTYSSIAPNSWFGEWSAPGSRFYSNRTKDRTLKDTDECPHEAN